MMRHYSKPNTVRLMLHFGSEYGYFVEIHFVSTLKYILSRLMLQVYKCLSETQSSALS